MNLANLQIEGLLMAIASINHVLVRRGLLSAEDIEIALRKAEAIQTGSGAWEGLSPVHRSAISFPILLLQLANRCQPEADLPCFSELAGMVGRMKAPGEDQDRTFSK
ncbi:MULTISPECIES: hypothetical protein [unclassified Ensifer]|uniref:hypothetical protein n=1 Tax=unclassified Ensifer TaxID=2633371 RepID=UPI000709F257|nr:MULTISPECIES: hypothetical protein [unclassified Ensifer]KQW52633.1 hypothetical protein ASD02_31520 [Ensifer sp. Root1252]KRC71047.1 hypothetical protein ASE32_33510 [Ensifer sp. Root231]KRC96079.1 hypothetical protein ASE47_32680 [Ensifer sp. Root258]